MKIAPSILSADFSKLGEELRRIEEAGADSIHIDVMDGIFVPNITIGQTVISSMRPITKLHFDVHLMITEPDRYIDSFVEAGADRITVHAEASKHLHRTINKIKSRGIEAGVALNPASSLSMVEWILEDTDMVLLMTVNPGFGGQKLLDSMLLKIKVLSEMIAKRNLKTPIQVDGGIDASNVAKVVKAGAEIIVSGSGLFKAPNMKEAVDLMRLNAIDGE